MTSAYRTHPARTEDLARIARANAVRLMIVLFFQEIAWLVLHRLTLAKGWAFYHISEFHLTTFLLMVLLASSAVAIAALFARSISRFPRIQMGGKVINVTFLVAIIGNIISADFLTEGARYTAGGLTGVTGFIYGVAKTASLMAMVFALKGKYGQGRPVNRILLLAFILSVFATIDGLATALTITCFLFLMLETSGWQRVAIFFSLSLVTAVVFYYGLSAKFTELPAYFTPEFAVRWAIARMSIAAESLYKFLSGESMFNEPYAYIDLLKESYYNRYQLLIGERPLFNYPKSVAEGFYMDMHGRPGAGSSPGLFLGTGIHGIFAPVFLLVFVWLFMQFFFGFSRVLSFVHIFAIGFILKAIHANVTEYIVLISPNTLALFGFTLACLIRTEAARRRVTTAGRPASGRNFSVARRPQVG